MTIESSPSDPITDLSLYDAIQHYNFGSGATVYMDVAAFMNSSAGSYFSIDSLSDDLISQVGGGEPGSQYVFTSNRAIRESTGNLRAVESHNFYKSSVVIGDNAVIWGRSSAGFTGIVQALGNDRYFISGYIKPFDTNFDFSPGDENPAIEFFRNIGSAWYTISDSAQVFDIEFVGRGLPVYGVFEMSYGWLGQPYIERVDQCFSSKTLVLVGFDRRVGIASISPGDIVLSYDARANKGRGALVPRRVVRIYRNTTTEWLRLTWVEGGERRELVTTPGHHFLDEFGQFPTIAEMTRTGRATVVLASGELAEVTAERIVYSAETAHLFERAVAQGAVAGNAAAQPVELDAWATYNFEVEDLHTYVAEGARPGERAAPLWPPGAPVRVRRARTGCLWQTVSDEPPEHKRTAESRCRCRTLPGGTGRERTEHPHSGSSLRPPNRRETTRNRRRWTGAMRWRMWSAA